MKQLIVLVASIMLGMAIVNALLFEDDSIFNSMQHLWQKEVEIRDMRNNNETIYGNVCCFAIAIDSDCTNEHRSNYKF